MKLNFKDVPYQRWRKDKIGPYLRRTKASIRIMAIIGEEIAKGSQVDFEHKIVNGPDVYDTISVKISP